MEYKSITIILYRKFTVNNSSLPEIYRLQYFSIDNLLITENFL